MDLHKFLSFIFTQSFFLTRLDKFEDQREGIAIEHLITQDLKRNIDTNPIFDSVRQYMVIDTFGNEMNQIEDELKKIQRFHFANCWVIGNNKSESVAMWNLYSNPNSLAIKIKYKDFKEKVLEKGLGQIDKTREIILAPVRYIDFQNMKEVWGLRNSLLDSVFIKDISFEHEKEFRIVVKEKYREIPMPNYKPNISRAHIDKLHNSQYDYSGITLKLNDFKNYDFEIVHHPRSEKWAKENINNILEKFKIKFKVSESSLHLK